MSATNKRAWNVRRTIVLAIVLLVAYVGAMGPAAWMIARYPKYTAFSMWTNTVFYPVNVFRNHGPSWLVKPYNQYLEHWWMSGFFAGGGTITTINHRTHGTVRPHKSYWAWLIGR